MKKKRKHGKKSAKKRSGLTLAKSGKRRKAKKKSGFDRNLDSWKRAGLASLAMRAGQGIAAYIVRRQGLDIPKVRVLFPAAVAIAASQGIIPIDGLFPVALDQAINAGIDTSPMLRDAFDLRFLDAKKPGQPASQVAGPGAMSVRQIAETRRQLSSRNGLTYQQGLTYSPSDAMNRSGIDDSDSDAYMR